VCVRLIVDLKKIGKGLELTSTRPMHAKYGLYKLIEVVLVKSNIPEQHHRWT